MNRNLRHSPYTCLIRRSNRRFIAFVSVRQAASKKHFDNIFLPTTAFPRFIKSDLRAALDEKIHRNSGFDELYEWQSARSSSSDLFVLHDGPPYANGNVHMGHALNKILKDVICRYKVMRNYKVHFRPGWDCHGLPIELKAMEKLQVKLNWDALQPLQIREIASDFAKSCIKEQMKSMKRWGVMADWSNPYLTFSREYETRELELFRQLWKRGLIYQNFMPTHWSPSSKTALAEAELEYNDDHESTALFVKLYILNSFEAFSSFASAVSIFTPVFAIIWTLTPWSLPCNDAVCFNPDGEYCLVRPNGSNELWLIARKRLEALEDLVGNLEFVEWIPTALLSGVKYKPPFAPKRVQEFYPAEFVSAEKGTGLVHVSFSLGFDDFSVATKYGLPVTFHINDQGTYADFVGSSLTGVSVLDANEKVLSAIDDVIVHQSVLQHTQPYDWRTKQPVIVRASQQWFINVGQIRKSAINSLSGVYMFPEGALNSFLATLERRPDWCISRQRVWGVPIPAFTVENRDGSKRTTITNDAIISHIMKLFGSHGSDAWWTLSIDELFPEKLRTECGISPDDQVDKCKDILDIWFDSGSSWFSAELPGDFDLICEGVDQFRGWFSSLLLLAIGTGYNRSPYRSLLAHGFVLDDEGKKMSKSLGNVVDPADIINGRRDFPVSSSETAEAQSWPALGADGLRFWVARYGTQNNCNIGPAVLQTVNDGIYQIRNSLAFILGAVSDFDVTVNAVDYNNLLSLDKFLLHEIVELLSTVEDSFDRYDVSSALESILRFVDGTVSKLYITSVKDRLYCDAVNSVRRRSAQTVLHEISHSVVSCLTPILPHLAEEFFMHSPSCVNLSAARSPWPHLPKEWRNEELGRIFRDDLLAVRNAVVSVHEKPGTLRAVVNVSCDKLRQSLSQLQADQTSQDSELTELLNVSCVTLTDVPPPVSLEDNETENRFSIDVRKSELYRCARCRRYVKPNLGDQLCSRCSSV